MSRLTVGDLRNSRIATSLTICDAGDPRFLSWLNECEALMLNQGRFLGSVQLAQFCVNEGVLVWQREIGNIEQAAFCGQPMVMDNMWASFQRNLSTVQSCSSCSASGCSSNGCGSGAGGSMLGSCGHMTIQDRGSVCSMGTVRRTGNVLRTYLTDKSDLGKKLIFQGYDKNGIWVRTNPAPTGMWIDGEQIALAYPFVDTVTQWSQGSPGAVIKDRTNKRVLVFDHDPIALNDRNIAIYYPNETRPQYRTSFIPYLAKLPSPATIQAIVSLQHVELFDDNDFLVFQNLSAYKAAMQAVKAWEDGDVAKGNYHFYGSQSSPSNGRGVQRVINRGGAIPMLVAELRKATGDRSDAWINIEESNRFALECQVMR